MRSIKNWIKNKIKLPVVDKRLKIAGLVLVLITLTGSVFAGSLAIKSSRNTASPTPSPLAQDEDQSGEVAGISTDETNTPTPSPATARRIVPTSTPTSTPVITNNQPASDNNQSNENSSNNSNQQSQNNTSNQTPSPIPIPTATSTPEPTPTPTPDNSPFEAEWNVSWNSNQVSATVGASKPLKRCLYEIWGGSLSLAGESNGEGYGCSVGGSASGANKIWVQAESIYGETKDFGEKPPSQGNAQI